MGMRPANGPFGKINSDRLLDWDDLSIDKKLDIGRVFAPATAPDLVPGMTPGMAPDSQLALSVTSG